MKTRLDSYLRGYPLMFGLLAAFSAHGEIFNWELNREFDAAVDETIRIQTESGNIQIETGDNDKVIIEVRMSMRASEEEDANEAFDAVEFNFSETGNGVQLVVKNRKKASWWFFGGSKTPNIEIYARVPEYFQLNLESGSGNISAAGVNGTHHLEAGSGNLSGHNLSGDITLQTGSGNITLDSVQADIVARAGSGNIKVNDLDGVFEAQAGSGNIHVSGQLSQFDVTTGSGSISVVTQTDRIDDSKVTAGSGDIEIAIPFMANVSFEGTTHAGTINCDFPTAVNSAISRNSASLTINEGGPLIRAHTGSGKVSLRPLAER